MFSKGPGVIRRILMALTLVLFLATSRVPAGADGHSATVEGTGGSLSTTDSLCTNSVVPTIAPSYFDPSTINPEAFSYQMADYDAPRNRVVFYPYGSYSTQPISTSGVLLFYEVGGGFTNPASWQTVDLTQVLNNPNLINFGGGFLNTDGRYAYLSPAADNPNPVAVKIDLAAEYADPGNSNAYEVFEPGTLSGYQRKIGGFGGVFAAGYAYFDPGDGIALRYDSTGSFSSAGSWQGFDLTTINDPNASKLYGMQSMAYVPPYVYYIPFSNGLGTNHPTTASVLVRYDTTKDFTSASSYEVFDLESLGVSLGAPADVAAQLNGFTGGVVVGTSLMLVPWGLRNIKVTNSVALIYDTTRPLNDPGAWQYMDLRTVDSDAGGYQLGWLGRDGFVWFVPTHNYNDPTGIPPFICWNSNLPFTCIDAWHTYPNPRSIWSCGAAYDPATNTAWFSPWGDPPGSGGPAPGLVTQFQVSGCPTITIGPASLLSGTVGAVYPSTTFTQSGSYGTITWSESGTLPTGMTFSDGTLSGTPAQNGSFPITITATDGNGCTRSQDYTLTILVAPPVVTLIKKMGAPFRLVVTGSNLQNGITVSINETPWANVGWKSPSKIVIKGGQPLKTAVPKGTPTIFSFMNPDGGMATLSGWSW